MPLHIKVMKGWGYNEYWDTEKIHISPLYLEYCKKRGLTPDRDRLPKEMPSTFYKTFSALFPDMFSS